jgi:hypothetical protein
MPDNPSPSAKPDAPTEPIEFNFDKPAPDSPRLKRRSLKGKSSGLKPATPPVTARDLENEAPPLTAEQAAGLASPLPDTKEAPKLVPQSQPRPIPVAPPRTTPVVAGTAAPKPANGLTSTAASTTTAPVQKPVPAAPSSTGQKVAITLTSPQKVTTPAAAGNTTAAKAATSPHGTRPATLYYTNATPQPRKEAPESMKPNINASPSGATTTSSTSHASATRPAGTASTASTTAASATRPAGTAASPASRAAASSFDYRANVERQSREQKSVGNILAYFVYGLIAVFVLGAILAGYGAYTINKQLHDESTSISSLDAKYTQKVDLLTTELSSTQDQLTQTQAQLTRQQDLLTKQEEEISQLRTAISAASSASADAIHAEARARAQEAAALRARIRDLEYRTSTQTFTRP